MCHAVLRMLAAYVGTDKFLQGVSIYLKNHLYGNSITRDLWDGISKATGTQWPMGQEKQILIIDFVRCGRRPSYG